MAKPNYQFQKRQKELAKLKKQEEKKLRKLEKAKEEAGEHTDDTPLEEESPSVS